MRWGASLAVTIVLRPDSVRWEDRRLSTLLQMIESRRALVVLFLLGAAVRTILLPRPVDQPSSRECDLAGIARNYYREGMNLFYPRIDWRGNSPGYGEMESPIYPWIMAALYQVFGCHEVIGRVLSYVASVLGLVIFFWLAQEVLPPLDGLFRGALLYVFAAGDRTLNFNSAGAVRAPWNVARCLPVPPLAAHGRAGSVFRGGGGDRGSDPGQGARGAPGHPLCRAIADVERMARASCHPSPGSLPSQP